LLCLLLTVSAVARAELLPIKTYTTTEGLSRLVLQPDEPPPPPPIVLSGLRLAPHAQAVCSFVGAHVMVNDFAARPPRALNDNEVLDM